MSGNQTPTSRVPHSNLRVHAPHAKPLAHPSRTGRRLAGNFAALSAAEIACRFISMLVTLQLARRLGTAGYGRIEFAFHLTFWLVLLVREGLDVIAAREIARHPRLVRPLVGVVMAIRLTIAGSLLALLLPTVWIMLPGFTGRVLLSSYSLMLLTTAVGIDYVYRGLERMHIVAASLFLRTACYALGVAWLVRNESHILLVPVLLVCGELCGIAFTWCCHARRYGWPRPHWRGGQFLRVFLVRGRTIYVVQITQTILASIDVLIVGSVSGWSDVGLYSASHRMVSVALTFGVILQQVSFPALARVWRASPASGQRALATLVRVLISAYIPLAVGTSLLAEPLIRFLFNHSYAGAAPLLAIAIWRVPLLSLAFLYQLALIALNRESTGMRLLMIGAVGTVPLTLALRMLEGLPGAAIAAVLTAGALAAGGYWRIAREQRAPAWHHDAIKPVAAASIMGLACVLASQFHVALAVLTGLVVYPVALALLGGISRSDLRMLWPARHATQPNSQPVSAKSV